MTSKLNINFALGSLFCSGIQRTSFTEYIAESLPTSDAGNTIHNTN